MNLFSDILEFVDNLAPNDLNPSTNFHIIDMVYSLNKIFLIPYHTKSAVFIRSRSYHYLKSKGCRVWYDQEYKAIIIKIDTKQYKLLKKEYDL